MVRRSLGTGPSAGVSKMSVGIDGAEELGRYLHIPYWQGEVEADEGLCIVRLLEYTRLARQGSTTNP